MLVCLYLIRTIPMTGDVLIERRTYTYEYVRLERDAVARRRKHFRMKMKVPGYEMGRRPETRHWFVQQGSRGPLSLRSGVESASAWLGLFT